MRVVSKLQFHWGVAKTSIVYTVKSVITNSLGPANFVRYNRVSLYFQYVAWTSPSPPCRLKIFESKLSFRPLESNEIQEAHLWLQSPGCCYISQVLIKYANIWYIYPYKSNFKNATVATSKMAVTCGEWRQGLTTLL